MKLRNIFFLLSSYLHNIQFELNDKIVPPSKKVSIIMPTIDEEKYIEFAVSSIRSQSIIQEYPDDFEFILVDSNSVDRTVEIACNYVDKIIYSDRGKLTARNLATKHAKGDIIVSVDADCFYPYHWLNTLLEPFNDKNVVAACGSTVDNNVPIFGGVLFSVANTLDKTVVHKYILSGRNSAYLKETFYKVGEFNTDINQLDVKQVVVEEEIEFGRRLAKHGKVIYKHNAPCIHLDTKRKACRFGIIKDEYCSEIGKRRF